jgi:transcriptional regulator with XRE-family HTH domain
MASRSERQTVKRLSVARELPLRSPLERNTNPGSQPLPKKQANPVDAQVGNRVRLRRMLIGMSQERLGELLGLTFQQVQKYEKGVNRIGAGRLFQVAHILGVPISYFYEGVAEQMSGSSGSILGVVTPPVMEFLASGEGLQLSLAFMRVKDAKVRKRVIDLIKSLATDEEQK